MRPMHRPSCSWLVSLGIAALVLSHARVALAQHAAAAAESGASPFGMIGFLMIGAVLLIFVGRFAAGSPSGRGRPGPQARAWMNVDVSAVRLGIDARSRTFMEHELGKISTTGVRPRELVESLRAVVRLLRKCDTAWTFGGASNYHPMSAPIAEGVFQRHAQDARAKYAGKIIHHASGIKAVRASADARGMDAEGPSVAMITLVVAARREIRDFFGGRRDEIHAVLDDLEKLTPEELVALEVVWLPEDPDDRMSQATLEALEPDIARLPPVRSKKGQPAPAVHCAHCEGPFALDLPTCPHCGAPAPSEAEAESA